MPRRENSGRKPGIPNKITTEIRNQILEALHAAGGKEGAIGYLKQQAVENPVAFMTLVGKCVPREVTGKVDNNITFKQVRVNRLEIGHLAEEELDVLESVLRRTNMLERGNVIDAVAIESEDGEAVH